MSNIVLRGGPASQVVPGYYTCAQQICSAEGCVPTGIEIHCMNAEPNGYDMTYNGLTMQCDGDTNSYPYNGCTCTIDYAGCPTGSSITVVGLGDSSGDSGSGSSPTSTSGSGGNDSGSSPTSTTQNGGSGSIPTSYIGTGPMGNGSSPTSTTGSGGNDSGSSPTTTSEGGSGGSVATSTGTGGSGTSGSNGKSSKGAASGPVRVRLIDVVFVSAVMAMFGGLLV